jgi:hypothetical protein
MMVKWRSILASGIPTVALAAAALVPAVSMQGSAPQLSPGEARAAVARSGPLSPQERARQAELSRLVLAAHGVTPSDEALAARGFLRVSSAPSQELVSTTNADVTMGTPYVYWDTTYYRYTAVAKYSWDNQNYGCCGDIGGDDGFGIRASRAVGNEKGTTGAFFGRGYYYGTSIVKNPAANNQYGVAYKYQDEATAVCCGHGIDYNMYSGTVTMGVNTPGCHKADTYFYASYFHTWSTTGINSIGVASNGFSVGWSSSGHQWTAASAAGKWNGC